AFYRGGAVIPAGKGDRSVVCDATRRRRNLPACKVADAWRTPHAHRVYFSDAGGDRSVADGAGRWQPGYRGGDYFCANDREPVLAGAEGACGTPDFLVRADHRTVGRL